jgi:hypothetical protein
MLLNTFLDNVETFWAFALIRSRKIMADSTFAGLFEAFVDVNALVRIHVVGKLKANVATAPKAALEVDAVAVVTAKVWVTQTLVDVHTMAIG